MRNRLKFLVCQPEVFLPFDTDFNDYSGSKTYIRTENVTLENGAACFNGNSVIAMPKFANMDMGKSLYLRVRYREANPHPGTQALVYNGDCDERSSMIIGTRSSGNSFSVRTQVDEYQTMWIPRTVCENVYSIAAGTKQIIIAYRLRFNFVFFLHYI